jgi:hypothetical protein
MAVAIVMLYGVDVNSTPYNSKNETMPNPIADLIGNWEKITRSNCSEKYPSWIQFQNYGLYIAKNDPAGGSIIWDTGTYQIIGPREIDISLANDAIVTYRFSIEDGVLILRDTEGCEFKYRKIN